MGFYAPAQIVRDAKEHGVEIPPGRCQSLRLGQHARTGDAGRGPFARPPCRDGRRSSTPTMRCGSAFARSAGFPRTTGARSRSVAAPASIRSATCGCAAASSPSALERLAAARHVPLARARPPAGAVGGAGAAPRRRQGRSAAVRPVRLAGARARCRLPPMRLGEQVVEDYRHLHLSLKAHPVSFLRGELARRGILRHEQLAAAKSGRRVTVAGLVLVRQRPGSANGVIFMTLEDETAVANTIVWPQVFETFRPIVLGARLVARHRQAAERIRRHPRGRRAARRSHAAAQAPRRGRPAASKRSPIGDEVRRPIREQRPAGRRRRASARAESATFAEVAPAVIRAAMPKGRNFH